ncbi:MAG: class I tRNA ligase family protein [Patescibacteria group bacterium]
MDILKGNKVGKEDDYKLIKKAVNFTLYTIEDKTEIVFTKIFTGDGVHINSDFLNGLGLTDSLAEIINWLEKNKCGKGATIYKLRDWVFSRQRYWGEPIPLVFCENCKNKKQKALLIHGFEGTGDGNWFAWIKQELEKAGFEVFNPTMTTSEHPVLEQWFEELMPFVEQMGEDDIIVGHSLGAKAALHLIEKAGKKFKALYLVAPVLNAASDKEYDLLSEKWQGSDIDLLKKFSSEPYDFRKISDLVESKNVIFSDDDPYIRVESKNILPAGWNRQVWNGFGHFQNKEISELLNLISKSKNTGWVALPEIELPLVLPEIKEFQAGDDGESPLSKETKWVATTCLKCGGSAKRETDTMPQWAGSSWYFLRYIDPQNNVAFADEKKLSYWTPIDWYNGGMEHTTLHLLYSRFWHKFLFDLGYAPTAEPYAKRTSHGMVLGEGSEKMSKSRGNVVNPDQVIKDCGADTLRMYEMFMGPFDQAIPWDTKGVLGVRRFLEKVWLFFGDEKNITKEADEELERVLNKTIKKVGEDIETMHFNTAVSAMMILVNKITEKKSATKEILEKFLIILSPFAPHLTEELWGRLGHQNSIALEKWPAYDKVLIKDEQVEIVVQVNGKVRAKILVSADISEGEVVELAGQNENVKKYLEGQQIKKTVFVPGKLISFVV